MENQKLLEILKPIMIDGLEPTGSTVYSVIWGEGKIERRCEARNEEHLLDIRFNDGESRFYTILGYLSLNDKLPALFKRNPYDWLLNKYKNQERLISVLDGNIWKNRVLISFTDKGALCWSDAETVSDAKNDTTARCFGVWKEIPRTITISDAFKMLQTEDRHLIRQLLTVMGYDTAYLIIE